MTLQATYLRVSSGRWSTELPAEVQPADGSIKVIPQGDVVIPPGVAGDVKLELVRRTLGATPRDEVLITFDVKAHVAGGDRVTFEPILVDAAQALFGPLTPEQPQTDLERAMALMDQFVEDFWVASSGQEARDGSL